MEPDRPTLEFWGVRGSLPSPGPDTVRYGGNTSCVALRPSPEQLVVLDAGSGIRALSGAVGPDVHRIDILISHLHMDHIQGLGFFGALFDPGVEVHIWGPRSPRSAFRDRLMRYLSAPLFPVHLHDLPCKLFVHDVPLDSFEAQDVDVFADLVCHPGNTVGFRLLVGGSIVTYVPDHEPALGSAGLSGADDWRSGQGLAVDADVLIHDTQYDAHDYQSRIGWGHSAFEHTLEFAAAANVKHLVPFHFDPTYDDARLDELFDIGRQPFDLTPAREGLVLAVGDRAVVGA